MKKIILATVLFLFSFSLIGQTLAGRATENPIHEDKWEILFPTLRIPINASEMQKNPEVLRIRYFPMYNYYYDSSLREHRNYECLSMESVMVIEGHGPLEIQAQRKINGVWTPVTLKLWPSRISLETCGGTQITFNALVPGNHDSNPNYKYSPLFDVEDILQLDFD